MNLNLSKEEIDFTRQFLSKRRSVHEKIDQYIEKWETFIEFLESDGFGLPVESYINILDNRKVLSHFLTESPKSLRDKVSPIVETLDGRFISVTREPSQEVYWSEFYPNEPWGKRIPIQFTDDDLLERDLKRLGYI